ncbi:MAG: flavodoxin family protein [Clostridia bacterium]|nr:flavodoxin family protein [Clostridia bacterium]
MKVVAINGSQRKDGNTAILIDLVFGELRNEGIECELIQLGGTSILGCTGCMGCAKSKNRQCVNNKDIINECIEKMVEADGILLGSPTYIANLSSGMKAFMERTGLVTKVNGDLLRRKVGAAVVSARRCGAINVFNSLNEYFLVNEMIIPGSNYWNLGVGNKIGEVETDEEGIKTMKILGQNMAWLLKKLKD